MKWVLGCILATLVVLSPLSGASAPTEAVHELDWFVHVDLLDPGAGQDLAFYQSLLDSALAEADVLIEGHQGPADAGCCVRLDPTTVSTFGSAGDGLDVIDDQGELDTVFALSAGAYLTQSVFFCGGTASTTIRGCAQLGGERMVVALDADDAGFLPTVIAHERGHNAGLDHVSSNPCQLMSGSNGGGCLSASECQSFIADANAIGASCECLNDTVGGAPEAIGTSCSDGSGCGLCSGGVCDACTSLAGAYLFAAGGPGSGAGVPPTDAIVQAGAAGDWDVLAALGASVTGLAHDPVGDVIYGIESRAGDDALVILDKTTGAISSTVGVLSGREEVIALAYDPQTSGGRLFAIEVDDLIFGTTTCGDIGETPPCFSELFEIDPSSAAQTNLGELNTLIITEGVQALAWADTSGVLYGATPAGLVTIEVSSCTGSTCPANDVDNEFRDPVSLTWDPLTGLLVREGDDGFGTHSMDVIDTTSGTTLATRGIDAWTAGGLAVLPVPEPSRLWGQLASGIALASLASRRRRSS